MLLCAGDGWLEISSEELDAMMRKAAGYLPPDKQVGPVRPANIPLQYALILHYIHTYYIYSSLLSSQSSTVQAEREDDTGELGPAPDHGGGLESMVQGVKSFVDTVSSHKGAELPW